MKNVLFIAHYAITLLLYSDGETPFCALNWRLKFEIELNPDFSAISAMGNAVSLRSWQACSKRNSINNWKKVLLVLFLKKTTEGVWRHKGQISNGFKANFLLEVIYDKIKD